MRGRFAAACWACALALAAGLTLALPLHAQVSRETPAAAFEPYKLRLDQLESTLSRDGLSGQTLADLRAELAPLRDELRGKSEGLEPKLAELNAKLKQLGDPPEGEAAVEAAGIAAERAELNKLRREIDGALKQAKLLMTRADQIGDRVTERRRAIFTRELLHRSISVASPAFWSQLPDAVAYELRSLGMLLGSWSHYAMEQSGRSGIVGALLTILAIFSGAAVLWRWKRQRFNKRVIETRFGRSVAALLVLSQKALIAPAMVIAALWVLDAFRLIPDRLMEIAWGLVVGVAVGSLGGAVGSAVFAPDQPGRRLPSADDRAARAFSRHLTWGLRVLGATIFLNIVHKAIVAPVTLTVATSALLAAVVAGLLVSLMSKLRDGAANAAQPPRLQWARLFGWNVAAVLVILLLTGHIGLSAFVAGRLMTLAAIVGTLYLLLVFTDSLFADALSANAPGGRSLATVLGLKPRTVEMVGMLLSGAIRVALVLSALFIVVGPWGILAADFFGAIEGAVFGFKIGEITFSLSAIFGAVVVLLIGFGLTRALQGWLQRQFLPRTGIEPSLQLSIATIVGYVGVIATVALSLAELGIDLQKIALVAGALSVGIGFGLQSIVSNFVSGLILLAERPIRVGDSIVVKGEEGYVRRISVRATEIETFERASVIVPNSELITGVVKNWTHANTTGRIIVKVGVAYDSDAEKVRELLLAAATDHPQVMRTPPPRVFLMAFGDSALEFELRCVVGNVDYALAVKSDLHFAILNSFRAAGIDIPYPQREVRVRAERQSSTVLAISKAMAARSSEG